MKFDGRRYRERVGKFPDPKANRAIDLMMIEMCTERTYKNANELLTHVDKKRKKVAGWICFLDYDWQRFKRG